ncbi:hypothetical protein SCP_1202290 [Sparassis crispa]|uniref:Uncharacterized protein n=1 Tax=Sparassis crispa TaxID=139825 RepID=A0A401H0T0_9APHY|nr:hypothetical protein SCP_1202290 [Sparassis crispa]GBE88003.1 hypothetical protein SCP_1202290 [Sparassis crispa]
MFQRPSSQLSRPRTRERAVTQRRLHLTGRLKVGSLSRLFSKCTLSMHIKSTCMNFLLWSGLAVKKRRPGISGLLAVQAYRVSLLHL